MTARMLIKNSSKAKFTILKQIVLFHRCIILNLVNVENDVHIWRGNPGLPKAYWSRRR